MNSNKGLKNWVDLHTHTNRSDGTLSPSELVKLAISKGLSTISITDHDTISGIKEAVDFNAAQTESINIINGTELSAKSSKGTLHILGYNINISNATLLNSLEGMRKIRKKRNAEIIAKLNQIGVKIDKKDFHEVSTDNDSQGRPHIARVLVNKQIVSSIDQAFAKYLGKNKKAFVPKKLYSAEEAISLIHQSGGYAFLAHPKTLMREGREFENYLEKLIELGLDGIEVYAPLHSEKQTYQYLKIAMKKNLLISAGSDFHGSIKPTIELGYCSSGAKIDANQLSPELFSS